MNDCIKAIADKLGTFDDEPLAEFPTYEESGWPEIFEELHEENKRHRDYMLDLINTFDPF